MKINDAIKTLDKRLTDLLVTHPDSKNYLPYRDEIEAIKLAIKALVVYPEPKKKGKK